MFEYIIYKYTSPSGKIYIGQTNDEKRRKRQHKNDARLGSKCLFHKAIRKYGFDNFKYEVLVNCKTREEVNSMEVYYINKYKTTDRIYGYNSTNGGDGVEGFRHSEDAKRRIREFIRNRKVSEETRRRMSESNKGKVRSEETRLRISNSKKGDKHPKSKTKEYYATKPTLRSNFKIICKKQGWNFDDFDEVVSGEVYVSQKGQDTKKFFYIYVGNGKGSKVENSTKSKPKEYYANKTSLRSDFKKICKYQSWNFEDFEEVFSGDKSNGGHKKYFYIYKGE